MTEEDDCSGGPFPDCRCVRGENGRNPGSGVGRPAVATGVLCFSVKGCSGFVFSGYGRPMRAGAGRWCPAGVLPVVVFRNAGCRYGALSVFRSDVYAFRFFRSGWRRPVFAVSESVAGPANVREYRCVRRRAAVAAAFPEDAVGRRPAGLPKTSVPHAAVLYIGAFCLRRCAVSVRFGCGCPMRAGCFRSFLFPAGACARPVTFRSKGNGACYPMRFPFRSMT